MFFGVQFIKIFQMLFNKKYCKKKKKKISFFFFFTPHEKIVIRTESWVKNRDTNRIVGLVYRYSPIFHCMVQHGTVRYGSLLGFFPLGTVPGTWYFFSTTSVEVPCEPYRYQNVTCKLYWSLIGRRKSSLLRHWTCDTRPSSTARPARFKSAQPAKDRTQLLFKQMHIFASTTK